MRAGRWLAGLLAASIALLLGAAGALAGGGGAPYVAWGHSSSRETGLTVRVDQGGKLILVYLVGGRAERCVTRAEARELRRLLPGVAGLPPKVIVIHHPGRKGGNFDRLTVSWRSRTHSFEDYRARRDLPVQAQRLIYLMARFARSHRHQLWITELGHQSPTPRPICHERI